MINEQLILKLMAHIEKQRVIGLVEEGFPEFTPEENDQIPKLCRDLQSAGVLDSKHKGQYFLTDKGKEFLKKRAG